MSTSHVLFKKMYIDITQTYELASIVLMQLLHNATSGQIAIIACVCPSQ